MALARLTVWSASQVLTASALNGEFNNILNSALSLISPLTSNLDFGGFRLITLATGTVSSPAIQYTSDTNTGIYSPGADVMAVASGGVDVARFQTATTGVNYFDFTPAAAAGTCVLALQGTDAAIPLRITGKGTGQVALRVNATDRLTLTDAGVITVNAATNVALQSAGTAMLTVTGTTSVDLGTNKPLIPAAVSGTPTQHALFRENTPKLYAEIIGTGVSLTEGYNVASVTDTGTGVVTVTIDRDFANATYAVVGSINGGIQFFKTDTKVAGSFIAYCFLHDGTAQDPASSGSYQMCAFGTQA